MQVRYIVISLRGCVSVEEELSLWKSQADGPGVRRCLEREWEKPGETLRMGCKEAEGRW